MRHTLKRTTLEIRIVPNGVSIIPKQKEIYLNFIIFRSLCFQG